MRFKIILATLILSTLVFAGVRSKNATPTHSGHPPQAVTVYKTVTCGCCANYISYLRTKNYDVEEINLTQENLTSKKRSLDIPSSLDSCHTTVAKAGGYFIEGHIPYEATDKLLSEKPDIKGIGMPGMPSASPGMPGSKTAPFIISQVDKQDALSNYLTL